MNRLSDLDVRLATLILVGLGGIVFLPVIGTALWQRFESQAMILWLAGGWFVATAAALVRYASSRCPECGGRFFGDGWNHNPFSRKCVSCGAPWPGRAQPGG